jgi:hypothetical protein
MTAATDNNAMHPLDAMRVAADHHKVLLENDTVRILDTRLSPGERTGVHAHEWPAARYILSWSNFLRRDPGGNVILDSRTLPARPEPGAALWGVALVPHFVENIGDSDLRIIAVEVKSSPAAR